MENVKEMTEELLSYLYKWQEVYEKSEKPEQNNADFFKKVQAAITPAYDLIDQWEVATKKLIQTKKITIFPQQIDATVKSMRAIALHTYYIDVRKRRYMDIHKSCEYVFQLLLREISS